MAQQIQEVEETVVEDGVPTQTTNYSVVAYGIVKLVHIARKEA